MSAPKENVSSMTEDNMQSESELYCVIEAKVPTGFEETAKGEAIEKLNAETSIAKGRLNIHLPVKDSPKALELLGVDNCFVLMTQVTDFPFSGDELESMRNLRELVKEIDWDLGLKVWKMIFSFEHPIISKPEVIPETLGEPTLSSRIHKPQKGDNRVDKKKKDKWLKQKGKKNKNEAGDEKSVETIKSDQGEHKEENKSECNHGNIDISSQGNNDTCSHGNNDSSNNINEKFTTSSASDVKSHKTIVEKPEDIDKSNQDSQDNLEDAQPAKKQRLKLTEYDPLKPSFRVTCNRNGENHCFDSMGAASNFGGAIYSYFHWNVDMKNFDIEVVLNIDENEVRVCLGLTKGSLHRRNLVAFGPTTLRPTIAYNLLRLCDIKPGDVVCDPMCGSGSIPVQAAVSWPGSYHIAGEIAHRALVRTWENVVHVNKLNQDKNKFPLNIDCIRWDVCNLPFKDESLDVIATDLPFGVRMGSKKDNWNLYPGALQEMARVCRLNTGRACLITSDKKCINKVIQGFGKLWKVNKILGINLGGLAVSAYLLRRTNLRFSEYKNTTSNQEENV